MVSCHGCGDDYGRNGPVFLLCRITDWDGVEQLSPLCNTPLQALITINQCNRYTVTTVTNRYNHSIKLAKIGTITQSINQSINQCIHHSITRGSSSLLLLNSPERVIKQHEVRDGQTRPVAVHHCTEGRLQVTEIPPVQAQLHDLVLAGA